MQTDRPARTVRELGGEIWAELSADAESRQLSPDQSSRIVDLVMAVLARHVGTTIENDVDLPVEPLPERFRQS